ncbi:hypothetical protein COO60DRAFT_1588619 [Scenedesmus sp. NREL 46B-D3]|nr:hypothetical protein COO60DRAFT_1588619 [Scenedesmus sp. NREL 46B-D3]
MRLHSIVSTCSWTVVLGCSWLLLSITSMSVHFLACMAYVWCMAASPITSGNRKACCAAGEQSQAVCSSDHAGLSSSMSLAWSALLRLFPATCQPHNSTCHTKMVLEDDVSTGQSCCEPCWLSISAVNKQQHFQLNRGTKQG